MAFTDKEVEKIRAKMAARETVHGQHVHEEPFAATPQLFAAPLLPGEHLLYVTGPHWIMLLPSVVFFVGSGMVFTQGSQRTAVSLLLLGTILFLLALYRYFQNKVGLTDRRIIATRFTWQGWLTIDIPLSKVESLEVYKAFLFSYGTVRISGTGTTVLRFPNLRAPEIFRQQIQQQLAMLKS